MPFANARKRDFSVLRDNDAIARAMRPLGRRRHWFRAGYLEDIVLFDPNDADQTLWFITLFFASMTVLLVVLTYAESSLTREEHGLNAIVARVWRSLRHRLLRLRAELAHSLGSTDPVNDVLPGHRQALAGPKAQARSGSGGAPGPLDPLPR